jgi:hypothetical protein
MNVEIGTEATQFPAKEYRNVIFLAVLSCYPYTISNDMTTYALSSIVPPRREVIREQ